MKLFIFILLLISSLIAKGQSTSVKKIDEHKTILSVFFAVSDSKINSIQSTDILKAVAHLDGKEITIKGYSDSTGNIVFNQKLAHSRVATIEDFIRINFPTRVIHSSSVGEDPLAKEHTLAEQRRVDIELTTSDEDIKLAKKKESLPMIPKEIKPEKKAEPIQKTQEQEFAEMMNSGDKIVFENVLFQPGKSKFQYDKTPNELYYLAEMMDTIPSMRIEIAGHVCCEDNMKLSEGRAKTVYLFLRGNGIDKSRISYKGFSNSDPRVEEVTPADQRKNRRVEIIVLER